MNYAEFERCIHDKQKWINEFYSKCLRCGDDICNHPANYLTTIKPDKYAQSAINKMPCKSGLYTKKYCQLCGKSVPNTSLWNSFYDNSIMHHSNN